MRLRQVKPPETYREPNPANRAGVFTMGPLRYATGKFKGAFVPMKPRRVVELVCERCKLPSYPGLPPFIKHLGFNRKTGKPEVQYVHAACPGRVAENRSAIAKFRAAAKKLFEDAKKLAQPRSRVYNAKRFR